MANQTLYLVGLHSLEGSLGGATRAEKVAVLATYEEAAQVARELENLSVSDDGSRYTCVITELPTHITSVGDSVELLRESPIVVALSEEMY